MSTLFKSGQTWSSGPQNRFELTPNFILIILISSILFWISYFFSISSYTTLHHISGVSSLDFTLEGARWLHHWIFKTSFNSIWILCPHHSGHLFPFYLASMSSILSSNQSINLMTILVKSLMDRYQDSLNPNSWGSSLVLGMIIWLMIGFLISFMD